MHEVSIIQQVVSTLDAELSEIEKKNLIKIYIHVGELSNVQPILLNNAFEAFQQSENVYPNSTMEIEQIPPEIYCSVCKKNSRVEKYIFRCKDCNTPSANVVRGEELLIHKLEFEKSDIII